MLPASVDDPPDNISANLGANTSFSLVASCTSAYQWQVSIDGGSSYSDLSNDAHYSNVNTSTLNITNVVAAMNGYRYRCVLTPGDVPSLGALLTVNPLIVNAKVILQAAWNGTSMTTTLRTLSRIPLTQPYNVAPWNYAGTENVGSIPANVVDWILVELRSTFNGAALDKRAGFLLNDGTIVDLNGSSPLSFPGFDIANYFIVVRHRNHLAIMSAAAQPLSSVSVLYDFTTASAQAYGATAPMATLSGGKFGLWGGNANPASNSTTRYSGPQNDPSAIFSFLGSASGVVSGYYIQDINMNGVVRYSGPSNDVSAIYSYVALNIRTSQVP
jgi:hypothetical protein